MAETAKRYRVGFHGFPVSRPGGSFAQHTVMKIRLAAPDRPSTRTEVMIGRSLALSLHPHMAWRLLSPSRRAALAFGYFAFAYATVLATLQLLW